MARSEEQAVCLRCDTPIAKGEGRYKVSEEQAVCLTCGPEVAKDVRFELNRTKEETHVPS